MKSFKQFLLETYRYVEDAWPYYMTKDGKIHDVDEGGHIPQIINDFNLHDGIYARIKTLGDDPSFDDIIKCEYDYVTEWNKKKHKNILFLVVDATNRILYVRGHKNDPTDKQRESLIEFCIERRLELEYDTFALA